MDPNSMAILEQLINEFYACSTTNARKHDIEVQLEAFKQNSSSWKHCLCSLTQNHHAYVWMYSVNIIEDVITKRWFNLERAERQQIEDFLWKNFKSKSNCTSQRYQINKLAKLLTDVAKREFPYGWQEYFSKILEMVKSNQCHLGIVLLHVTCEEIVTRNDVSSSRKELLLNSLKANLDHIFTIISQLLQSIMNKWSIGTTPPCSPNQFILNEELLKNIISAENSNVSELCFELLCTIQHLFSWIELSDYVSSDLLNTLFALADVTTQNSETLSIIALSAITEILYRKHAFAGLSTLLCEQIMRLIYRLNYSVKQSDMQTGTLTDSYLEKTTELIKSFVLQHYNRMLSEPTFDSLQFMSLLFHYTFVVNRQSVDCFMGCLEVWCILLDYVVNTNSPSYKDAILSIASSCFNNIVFSENEEFLSSIDTETLDDDLQSDWHHYLKQCFELISKIAEFYPYEILSMMVNSWKNLLNIYGQISNALNTVKQLSIPENEMKRVINLLHDLSTLCQCLSRLASVVSDENTSSNTDIQQLVHNIISKAMEACQYSNKHELYGVECSSRQMQIHLQHVHGHLLLILSSYISWLAQSHVTTQIIDDLVQCAIFPITSRHQNSMSNFQNGMENKITSDVVLDRACATLLLNISKILRPQNFLSIDCMQNLFSKQLDEKSTITLHQSIINNLTLPWQGVTNQSWNTRSAQLTNYITGMSIDFLNIPYNSTLTEHSEILENAIMVLRIQEGVLKYFEDNSSSVKILLKSAYEPLMEHALKIINHQSISGAICESIMSFFLTALMVLQHQLGAQFTGIAVTAFMNAVKREQLSRVQLYTVDKLLQILKLVVLLPGQAFKGFLPSIISLALDNISPLLNESNSEDAHDANLSLLHLFDAILQHRWQYFYKSQVLMGNSPVQSDSMEELNHVEQLHAMLLTYGQCLLNGDLTVFGTCLQSLERLNEKWRIYHKQFFRNSLFPHFLSALLRSLLNEQHGILFDNILTAIYRMAVVDLVAFCNIALIILVNSTQSLTEQEATNLLAQFQVTIDEPTFIQNLAKLIKDLKCSLR